MTPQLSYYVEYVDESKGRPNEMGAAFGAANDREAAERAVEILSRAGASTGTLFKWDENRPRSATEIAKITAK